MNRPRIAYLASPVTMPGAVHRRDDAYEHDLTVGHLGLGMHYIGRTLESVSWDDPSADWSQYEAAVVGTTWDYTRRPQEFQQAIDVISSQTRLFNSKQVILWNMQKTYLQSLQDAGCKTIATCWMDELTQDACVNCFDKMETDRLVIKPQVGAGAWRQVLFSKGDDWPDASQLPTGPAMVQPFQESIVREGEYSFLFFGNEFSHAVIKKPAPGDYRIQSAYGGFDLPYEPNSEDLIAAQTVLSFVREPLLYARVDMIRGDDGQLQLIELEVIEPYLYPLYAPQLGHRFAKAYLSLIERENPKTSAVRRQF